MSFDDDTTTDATSPDAYVSSGCASWRSLARQVSATGATISPVRLWQSCHGVLPLTPAVARGLREVSHRLITPPAPRTDALALDYDRNTATLRALAEAWRELRRRIRAMESAGCGDDTTGLRRARAEIAADYRRVYDRRRDLRIALEHVEAA